MRVISGLLVILLICPKVYADPPNYGITHSYAATLGGDFVSELFDLPKDKRLIANKTISAAIALGYSIRELQARKDGRWTKDSAGDIIMPIISMSLDWIVPSYREEFYAKHYFKLISNPRGKDTSVIYLTIYEITF